MNALVIGSGCTVWDDLRQVPEGWQHIIVAINDIGCYLPANVDHWASLHSEKLEAWEKVRKVHGGNTDYKCWTRALPYGVEKMIGKCAQVFHPGGSSGMLGVEVAKHVGATRIILCGVPMDPVPHFCRAEPWPEALNFRPEWEAWKHNLTMVRSVSGWTATLLGKPDFEQWPVPPEHLAHVSAIRSGRSLLEGPPQC